jgi:hypothetical protein
MNCPFCGVSTDVAHDSQEGCIEALRAEILRVRDVLQRVRPLDDPGTGYRPEDQEEPAVERQ